MTGLRAHVVRPDRGVDVTIEVAPGECVALIGPNGAGKSSVLEAVAGLLRHAGRVEISGVDVTTAPPHRRRVGLVAQRADLFPHLSVARNVAYGPRAAGVAGREARGRAATALAAVEVADLAHRAPATLSGGQAQRVAVARALATDPAVLLLDEPTSALDVDARVSVRSALATAVAGRPALLVTHDPLEVVALARRVVVVDGGHVVESGPTAEVLGRPQTPFAAAFSGLVLTSGTTDADGIALDGGGGLASSDRTVPPGRAAHAVYHPTAASVRRDGAGVPRRVLSVEPREGLVRIRAGELVADVTVAVAARLGVRPGDEVRLEVPPEEVTVFPTAPTSPIG